MIQWEVARFSYRGREKESLSEIRLRVHKGECVLFCGKSGCGKTTMLRFVNGLIPSFFSGEGEGEILLDGA
ncbi:MAG: ATP-binding cassette domain-containing protein, partial [Bacillota bacterium]|nr:ATP-binding cassette domain-containing protein [Bacillota bacterium]